jgi:hypothetical protein
MWLMYCKVSCKEKQTREGHKCGAVMVLSRGKVRETSAARSHASNLTSDPYQARSQQAAADALQSSGGCPSLLPPPPGQLTPAAEE